VTTPIGPACEQLSSMKGAGGTPWLKRWQHAEQRARAAIAEVADADRLTEPGVARTLVRSMSDHERARAVIASSMPIRDVEWYSLPGPTLEIVSNRGANGIDGTIATAIGVSLADPVTPVAVLLGDVAFLHDSSSLTALARRNVDLRIVVVDNDGGGIFSFLPQATALAPSTFEQLYGTPHGTDLVALARAHDLPARAITSRKELEAALGEHGPHVAVLRTDRAQNVEVHDVIHKAVRSALG